MADRYTKVVLTIIAACLVWICVRDLTLVRPAHAQPGFRGSFDHLGNLRVSIDEPKLLNVSIADPKLDSGVRVSVDNWYEAPQKSE